MVRRRPCQALGNWRQLASLRYWGWIVGRPQVWVTEVVPGLGLDIWDFIQRGLYGYAESDLYSLDTYLSDWIPSALRDIRPALLEQPGSMLGEVIKGYDEEWPPHNPTDADWAAARRKWEFVLDGMIAGWETVNDIRRHDSAPLPDETYSQRWRRQKRTIKKGMRLMGKHILSIGC